MKAEQSAITLELTAEEANEFLVEWEPRLRDLEQQKVDLEKRIKSLRKKVNSLRANLGGQSELMNAAKAPFPATQRRSAKGENLAKIMQHFNSTNNAELMVSEIHNVTGVGFSSVQAVMHRNRHLFEQNPSNGAWRLKQNEMKPETKATP